MNALLVGLALYVGAQLAIGVWVSRRIATEEDYFVAGRRLGPWLVGASVFATWFGAETCVGAAGDVYANGVGRWTVEPFAYGLCLVLAGLVFTAPLWRRRIVTIADLLRERFGTGVERLAALLLVPTSVLWAAAQVRAFGQVLSVAADGLDLEAALAIAAGVVIVYTVFGGLLADVFTDVVQGGMLVLGLAILVVVAVVELGGAAGVSDALARAGEVRAAARAAAEPAPWWTVAEAWAIPVAGSVVAQEVVSRALAARSANVARGATLAGGGAYLLVGLMPVFLGLVGPALAPDLADGEALLPHLAQEYLTGVLYVLFAGALVSAILSTADSALLVASSLLVRNLVERPSWDERRRLVAARVGVVLFGLVAWWLAHGSDGIYDLLEQASGFASSGMLVVVCFALFSRTGGAASAATALVLGTTVWLFGDDVGLGTPYLASLGAALAGYLAVAALARGRRR